MNKLTSYGFSLMELIICMAIIAILASSFSNYYIETGKKQSRRDAIDSLQLLLQSQQSYFQKHRQFNSDLMQIDWYHEKSPNRLISLNRHYQLSVATCQQQNTQPCIRLIAKALSDKALNDDACYQFSLNSKGQFSATNRLGESNTQIRQYCWQ